MTIEISKVISLIDLQQKHYIELAKKDKAKRKQVDAILTATTLLKIDIAKLEQK